MARGKQLQQLVADLRVETGRSTSVALGVDEEQRLKTMLARVQETLYDEYDWPHLITKPTKDLAAGQRYYDMPDGLNLDRIIEVRVWHNRDPLPLTRGIGFEEYAVYRSDLDDRLDPIMNWDIVDVDGDPQIEVWPIPASDNDTLQFIGVRDLNPLIANEDTADLDDRVIVLFAAAELLANSKSEDAQAKLGAAQERLARIKGRLKGGSRTVAIGRGDGGAYRRAAYKTTVIVSE